MSVNFYAMSGEAAWVNLMIWEGTAVLKGDQFLVKEEFYHGWQLKPMV